MFSLLRGERQALTNSLMIYIFSLFALFIAKPSFCFNEDGKLKEWGIGNDKTMFPAFIVSMIISIISLFMMTIIYS